MSRKRRRRGRSHALQSWRLKCLFFSFMGMFGVVLLRATLIQIVPPSEALLEKIGAQQYQTELDLSAYRGAIRDRGGNLLAVSMRRPSLAINPRVFSPGSSARKQLRKLLRLSRADLANRMKKRGYFAWLRRKVTPEVADQVEALGLAGIHRIDEPARFYPGNDRGAHLIGYVGIDNRGLLGLEHSFDSVLRGAKAKVLRYRDGRGRWILASLQAAAPQQGGHELRLTLDQAIQQIAEDALAQGVEASDAKGGFAIVTDPHTGGVLAMANLPGFNPNLPKLLQISSTANLASHLAFEPGSILKPLVIGQVLEHAPIDPIAEIDCEDGRFHLEEGGYIHDDHAHKLLNLEDILVYSSNIGTYKAAQQLGAEGVFAGLTRTGVGDDRLMLPLPGASRGRLSSWQDWRDLRFANIAFGQGLLVTGVEIAAAYGAIANGGMLMRPRIVERVEDQDGRVVESFPPEALHPMLSSKTSGFLRKALAEVVERGTGKNAQSQSYPSAGKTGTAEKYDNSLGTYSKTARIASFAGFAPVADPHIVVIVVIDEPRQKPYYGGKWAAPVFRAITERTLKYLGVPPSEENRIADKSATQPAA